MKQAIKKKSFVKPSSDDIRAKLGLTIKPNEEPIKMSELTVSSAEKKTEFIIMPTAFEEALRLPGIPMGYLTLVAGWSNTGKSTIKNCLIAACQRQGILPVIYETEGNFDWKYAIDCGVKAEPIYGDIIDDETGEVVNGIVNYTGDFLFYDSKILADRYGDIDHSQGKKLSTKRKVAVIEDIATSINEILDLQDSGDIAQPICFIWDSIGSLVSYKSFTSKVNNNMWDASAIAQYFNLIINNRIPSSRKVSEPYTNTLFCVNKLFTEMAASGPVSQPSSGIKGGKTMTYGARLIIHVGGVLKASVKTLSATHKGETYNYGIVSKIKVTKNQLPTPYHISYAGTIACVHNGLVSEDKLEEYKKQYAKEILGMIDKQRGEIRNITDSDVEEMEFNESENDSE